MPNKDFHDEASIVTAVAVSIAIVLVREFPQSASEAGITFAGALTGIFLTPDLDLIENSSPFRLFRKRRYISGFFWMIYWFYWQPYGRLVSHRSIVSHFPLISTIIRVIYFGWPLAFAWWWFQMPSFYVVVLWWLFLGLASSDFVHIICDAISSEF